MRALPVALTLMDQARARKHDNEYVWEDQEARRDREDPAASVNLAGEMRATGLMEPEDGPAGIV